MTTDMNQNDTRHPFLENLGPIFWGIVALGLLAAALEYIARHF